MKLSAVLALSSTVRAQDLDLADLLEGLEGIDLGDYGLTPDMFAESVADSATNDQLGEAALDSALAASAAAAELTGERYFGVEQATTPTITTEPTTVTTSYKRTGCFKCDQMTMAECAALGQFEYCEGEASMCFIELREVNQQVNQLCTGCKNTQACHELQEQNFLGTQFHTHQCRPHYIEQRPNIRSPRGQSTCRQCFRQCDFDTASGTTDGMCFMGHDSLFDDASTNVFESGANDADGNPFSGNRLIRYDQTNIAGDFENNKNHPLYGYTGGASTVGFGIPTGAIVEGSDDGVTSIPANADATVWNLYFASGADSGGNTGKTYPAAISASALGQEQRQMAYWGVIGASRAWWASDLVAIQDAVAASAADDKTGLIAV